jgi:hypothetical protein
VFGDYHPQMDTAARMKLWCAARGYRGGDGSHTWHDDEILTERIDIVLAETEDRQALVLAAIGTSPPQVFPDITTDTPVTGCRTPTSTSPAPPGTAGPGTANTT